MKLVDIYKINKEKYPKYLIMIKCGTFYEIYGEDAYILNNLFSYSIKNVSGINRAGFPISAYNKVTDKLNQFKINYIVIDKEIVKKRFNKNKYDEYISNLNLEERVNKIIDRINLLKNTPKINKLLDDLEGII